MAKRTDLRPVVTLRSTAGTGYSYVTRKNRRSNPRPHRCCASSTPSLASTSTSARPADLIGGGRILSEKTAIRRAVRRRFVGSRARGRADERSSIVRRTAGQRASVRACWSAGVLGDVLAGLVVGATRATPGTTAGASGAKAATTSMPSRSSLTRRSSGSSTQARAMPSTARATTLAAFDGRTAAALKPMRARWIRAQRSAAGDVARAVRDACGELSGRAAVLLGEDALGVEDRQGHDVLTLLGGDGQCRARCRQHERRGDARVVRIEARPPPGSSSRDAAGESRRACR